MEQLDTPTPVTVRHKPTLATRLRRLWLVCLCVFGTYVFSFGPACWFMTRFDARTHDIQFRTVSRFYEPVSLSVVRSPMWARGTIFWYLELGAPPDAVFIGGWPEGIGWSKPGYTYTLLSVFADQR